MTAAAPWDAAPREEQVFVLITGTNSGVGLGTCQRLIDEFLARRSLEAHLVLIITTRSVSKTRETVAAIRAHMDKSPEFAARRGEGRVHVVSVLLDLCDLGGVYAAAARLRDGELGLYPGTAADAKPVGVRIPRMDAMIFNAGFGAFYGISWLGFFKHFLTRGYMSMMTYPDYKLARVGAVSAQKQLVADKAHHTTTTTTTTTTTEKTAEEPVLGEVFCANLLGHYAFAHELMALLSREAGDVVPPGRIIWTSSIEPDASHFSMDDFQGTRTTDPYESSKRLTELLALTASFPSLSRLSAPYFEIRDEELARRLTVRPRMCVSHPGIVVSALVPLPFAWLMVVYTWCMYTVRWLGSPWHVVTGYLGATASVWLALAVESEDKTTPFEGIKWGASCDRAGNPAVKMTEVDGWGWEGGRDDEVEDARKASGRKPGARLATKETREEFEVLAGECWREMERVRTEWEERLGVGRL